MSPYIAKCPRGGGGKLASVESHRFRGSYFFPLRPVPASVIEDHNTGLFHFFISEGFRKECQGPRAFISEAGRRIISFHCTHIFTGPPLCGRMVLNAKRADINQTWHLDLSFKSGGEEDRQKDKTQRHMHILSEALGSCSSFPGGYRWALEAKEGVRGREGHLRQSNWHKPGPWTVKVSQEMAISLNK